MTWPMVNLGDVCRIEMGKTPSRKVPEYWTEVTGEGYLWMSIADMSQYGEVNTTSERITDRAIAESGIKVVPAGTLMMSFKLSIGKLAYSSKDLYTNEAIAALPIKDRTELDRDFLAWSLLGVNLLKEVDRAAKGKTLNKQKLTRIQIPLPQLDEQHRIAALLDAADALRRKRRAQLDMLDGYVRSLFLEMFGDGRNPNPDWPIHTIQEIAAPHKGSMRTGPFGSDLKHSEFVDSGIPVIGIDNAVENRFQWKRMRYITQEKYEKLKRYTLYPGDVIITIMATLGKSAVIPEDIPVCINSKHLAAITLNQEVAQPLFISYALHSSPEILNQLKASTRGAIMGGLNLGIIKNLKIHLPSLYLQQTFARQVEQVEATKARMKTAITGSSISMNSLTRELA